MMNQANIGARNFYTASYLCNLIGLPPAVCRERLEPVKQLDGRAYYDLEAARKLKAEYKAEKAAKRQERAKRRAAGLCVRCGAPRAVPGWPFCAKHVPPSVRHRIELTRPNFFKTEEN